MFFSYSTLKFIKFGISISLSNIEAYVLLLSFFIWVTDVGCCGKSGGGGESSCVATEMTFLWALLDIKYRL